MNTVFKVADPGFRHQGQQFLKRLDIIICFTTSVIDSLSFEATLAHYSFTLT